MCFLQHFFRGESQPSARSEIYDANEAMKTVSEAGGPALLKNARYVVYEPKTGRKDRRVLDFCFERETTITAYFYPDIRNK